MSWRIRDKQAARKATLAAQAGVVVLFASGVATAMFGPWMLEVEPAAEQALPDPGDPELNPPQEEVGAIDSVAVAEYLSYLGNTPQPDPETSDPGEPEIVAGSDDRNVRYIGSVRVGERAAAWVSIGGVTKLLRPGGDPFDGVALKSVSDDEIVITIDGSDEATLEKAERQGPAVTVLVGGAPPPSEPVVAGDEAESPRFSPDMSREERRAMLLDRARDERARWQRDRDDRGEGSPPDRNRR